MHGRSQRLCGIVPHTKVDGFDITLLRLDINGKVGDIPNQVAGTNPYFPRQGSTVFLIAQHTSLTARRIVAEGGQILILSAYEYLSEACITEVRNEARLHVLFTLKIGNVQFEQKRWHACYIAINNQYRLN